MSNRAATNMQEIREPQDYRTRYGLVSNIPADMPEANSPRQLIWTSCKPDHWEILIYRKAETWEACFFRWPIHHEHVNGASFNFVRLAVEQKICVLEAAGLKTAEWRQTIGCDGPSRIGS